MLPATALELALPEAQATLTAGCAGHFSREGGKVVALYLRRSVDRGSVRVGTVAMLKELRR